jgi:hypothetical protein
METVMGHPHFLLISNGATANSQALCGGAKEVAWET